MMGGRGKGGWGLPIGVVLGRIFVCLRKNLPIRLAMGFHQRVVMSGSVA